MATASKTYTFAPSTTIESAKVNQDFDDVLSFLNNSVVHRDGSTAFTGIPSGPSADPTTGNQFTRKSYVDAADLLRTKLALTAATAQTQTGGTFTPGTNQLLVIANSKVTTFGTGGSAGHVNITFDVAFPNGLICVIPFMGDIVVGAPQFGTMVRGSGTDRTQFEAVFVDANGNGTSGGSVRIDYVAFGW